jgi:hypothetical protein
MSLFLNSAGVIDWRVDTADELTAVLTELVRRYTPLAEVTPAELHALSADLLERIAPALLAPLAVEVAILVDRAGRGVISHDEFAVALADYVLPYRDRPAPAA